MKCRSLTQEKSRTQIPDAGKLRNPKNDVMQIASIKMSSAWLKPPRHRLETRLRRMLVVMKVRILVHGDRLHAERQLLELVEKLTG